VFWLIMSICVFSCCIRSAFLGSSDVLIISQNMSSKHKEVMSQVSAIRRAMRSSVNEVCMHLCCDMYIKGS